MYISTDGCINKWLTYLPILIAVTKLKIFISRDATWGHKGARRPLHKFCWVGPHCTDRWAILLPPLKKRGYVFGSVRFIRLSARLRKKLFMNGFWWNLFRDGEWPKDQVIRFRWRSGPRSGCRIFKGYMYQIQIALSQFCSPGGSNSFGGGSCCCPSASSSSQ